MSKKLAIFLASGFEECEALIVVDIVRRAGLEISTVSITGERTVVSSHNVPVTADKLFDEVNFDELDMIVLPGGMPGTKNLEAYEPLMKQLDDFNAKGKEIAAICAAPSIFGHRGYVNGGDAAIYPGMEAELKGANVLYDNAVRWGHTITGRGMGAAIDFSLKIVEVLTKDKAKAQKIGDAIVYKK